MHKLPQKIYFEIFAKESAEEVALTTAKNTDYANSDNAFQNFNIIEFLTNGKVSTEVGIITRMCDKFQRVASLITRPEGTQAVKAETVLDTLRDISVYAKILRIYIMTKDMNFEEYPSVAPDTGLDAKFSQISNAFTAAKEKTAGR